MPKLTVDQDAIAYLNMSAMELPRTGDMVSFSAAILIQLQPHSLSPLSTTTNDELERAAKKLAERSIDDHTNIAGTTVEGRPVLKPVDMDLSGDPTSVLAEISGLIRKYGHDEGDHHRAWLIRQMADLLFTEFEAETYDEGIAP